MKKYISIVLTLMLCFSVFAGCENSKEQSEAPDIPDSWSVDIASRDAAVPAPLSEEDSAALEELLSSDAWINDLTKCEPDVFLESSAGERYDYHSECGTFNDRNSKRYLTLDDEAKAEFNELLQKYGRLSADEMTADADVLYTEPPVLTVHSSDKSSIEALQGTGMWSYDKGDGTWSGSITDCVHPLDCKDIMPVLTLMPTVYSSKDPLRMFLRFDIAPDSVEACCWSEEYWGDLSGVSTPVEVDPGIMEGEYTFTGYDEGCIYVVTAYWNSYEKFNGTVSYSFFAGPMELEVTEIGEPDIYAFSAEYIRTDGYTDGASYPQVTVIDSREELDAYYDANKERYDLERREKVYGDTTVGFLDACDKYDEDYFSNEKNLVLITLEEPSGSIRHEVTEVKRTQDGWQVTVRRSVPEIGTSDMAEWHILLEVQMGNMITKEDTVSIVFSDK